MREIPTISQLEELKIMACGNAMESPFMADLRLKNLTKQ